LGAEAALVWSVANEGSPVLEASAGAAAAEQAPAGDLITAALAAADGLAVDHAQTGARAVVALGRPPAGALQLTFAPDQPPGEHELRAVGIFAARAAQALRARERAREVRLELDRTRALLAV